MKFLKYLGYILHILFGVSGITQIVSVVSMQQLIGSSASTYLLSHGITQPTFGVIQYAVSLVILIVTLELSRMKAAPSSSQEPKISNGLKKLVRKADELEKKYGTDWIDKVEKAAEAVNRIGLKKK